MKTLEHIEEEYRKFNLKSYFVTNLDELVTFLEIGLDDTFENEKDYLRELRENRRWKIDAVVRNFFFFLFEEEDVEFYDYDNQILKDVIRMIREYRSLFYRLVLIASEDSRLEIVKLVDFLGEYYNQHVDYFDHRRDQLEMAFRGFQMYNSKYEDNREVVYQFADKKISELEERLEKLNRGKVKVKA